MEKKPESNSEERVVDGEKKMNKTSHMEHGTEGGAGMKAEVHHHVHHHHHEGSTHTHNHGGASEKGESAGEGKNNKHEPVKKSMGEKMYDKKPKKAPIAAAEGY